MVRAARLIAVVMALLAGLYWPDPAGRVRAETATPAPVRPASEAEVRDALVRNYGRLDAAIAAKDFAAFFAMFTPEASITASGFEFPVLQYQAMLTGLFGAAIEVSQATEVLAVEVDGDKATVTARARVRVVTKTEEGTRQTVESEATSLDTWTTAGNVGADLSSWRIASSIEKSLRTWIDGIELGTVTPLSPGEREAMAGEVRAMAQPFETVDAGNGFDDIAFLDALIGEARVVALGESSHGSSEQFRMKRRIIEYLVKRKDFTVVAFEANWSASDRADDYVKGKPGNIAAAIDRLGYWIWRTEEVKGLVEWMRKENLARDGGKPLTFTGFDMQQFDELTACVLELFARTGGADLLRIKQLYEVFGAGEQPIGPPKTEAELKALIQDLRGRAGAALAIVDARRAELIAASSELAFQHARQCAQVIEQYTQNVDAGLSNSVRDRAMTDNVRWLAEIAHPDEKIVLWAHNGHVGVRPGLMGGHLRALFGKDLVTIGFASHHGWVRANPIKDGKVDGALTSIVGPIPIALARPADGSINDVLNAAGMPRFVIRLAQISTSDGVLGRWLAKPQSEITIGWLYDPTAANLRTIVLPETYDAMVFIAESSPSVQLGGQD